MAYYIRIDLSIIATVPCYFGLDHGISAPAAFFFAYTIQLLRQYLAIIVCNFKILAQVASYFRLSISAPVARFFRFYLLIFDLVIFGPVACHFVSNFWFFAPVADYFRL